MISGMLGPSTLQRFWQKKGFSSFLVFLVLFVQNYYFSRILMKKHFLASWPFPSLKIILIIFINNVLNCLPNMLTFALKEWWSKIIFCCNQLWKMKKMEKKLYVGKVMPCNFFQVSLKKNSVPHKSLHQKKRTKNMHFLMQRFLFHPKFCYQTWTNWQGFSRF